MKTLHSPAMPRRLPPGCVEDRDRHGNIRVYYREKGKKKVRLRAIPWSPEFMAECERAKTATKSTVTRSNIPTGTWRWLCIKYFEECADFKRLDPQTQHVRRLILENTFREPIVSGSLKLFSDMPLSKMGPDAVEVLRDRKINQPGSANNRLKAMRGVFKFAMRKKYPDGNPYLLTNPARDVEKFRYGTIGYHTWSEDEVRQFEERHPIGTKARLALALLLFTGQRRGDVIRFGRQHVRDGKLTFIQRKGRHRKPKQLTLPILPVLQRIIDASPCGDLTFLVNNLNRPFTDAGFGNRFRGWCDQAGLPICTAHGLRKAGATIAANNGATASQLMSIFGWESIKMAETYTRAADQQRLAKSAMHMLETKDTNRG
jgi:integrase